MDKIQPKKSLGQNFLRSKKALQAIVEAGHITEQDTVLEIGPGEGVLTEKLLEKAGQVVIIEKDHRLIPLLQEKFSKEITSGKLKLIPGDVLDITIEEYIPTATAYKLIANIPYYITGEILRTFLEKQKQPEKIVLLVQKEVADRIMARDKKESILSLSVKIYGDPKREMVVNRESFKPVPNVDSAI
ncbi:MAG: dimethyladenosine transferase, rRNA (adenine1518-N6/adenine1519-N6)-dimethyltransferase, partial [Candidatus Parcubacteria bacterium]